MLPHRNNGLHLFAAIDKETQPREQPHPTHPKKKPADQKADELKVSTEAERPSYLPLTFSTYSAIILI